MIKKWTITLVAEARNPEEMIEVLEDNVRRMREHYEVPKWKEISGGISHYQGGASVHVVTGFNRGDLEEYLENK